MMRNLLKRQSNPRRVFILTAAALVSFLFVSDIKSYLGVFVAYGLILFFFTSYTFLEIVYLLLFLSVPFERGIRDWMIPVVSPGPDIGGNGYAFYFGIAPKLILTYLGAASIIGSDVKPQQYNRRSWFLVFFLLLSFMGLLTSSDLNVSLPGFIRLSQSVLLYFVTSHIVSRYPGIRSALPTLFLVFLTYFGAIGVLQFFSGRPLGVYLEDSAALRPAGYLTTDGDPLYRVSGLFGHPTFFASFLSLLLPIGIAMARRHWMRLFPVAVGITSLIATFSRSAWLAVSVAILTLMVLQKKKGATLWLVAAFAILATGPLILSRLSTVFHIETLTSVTVRWELIKQTMTMISQFPLFGTGLNLFTRTMITQELPETLRSFIFPVHNTFLLFASELGLPATLTFIIFVLSVFHTSWKRLKNNPIHRGIWLGAGTFLINAQFHTLFNQDPTLDLFMILFGYLSVL